MLKNGKKYIRILKKRKTTMWSLIKKMRQHFDILIIILALWG